MTIARETPPAACQEGPHGEHGIVFDCGGDELVGVLHPAGAGASTGVLVVVGGPQYRVGSHRQFVLLARFLATCGIPVLRFDYRGMGDSAGASRDFERITDDIAVAIDAFQRAVPSILRVVVWGLCDAATAAACYAPRDPRVCGLVLLNPWVRTVEGAAQAHLRHYYHRRLLEPEFWRKLAGLRLDVRNSWRSFVGLVHRSGWVARRARPAAGVPLPEQLARALGEFAGHSLIVLSGNDLTAAEFRDCVAASTKWRSIMSRPTVTRLELAAADHTFSRRDWRDQVAGWTADWVRARWPVPESASEEGASAPG